MNENPKKGKKVERGKPARFGFLKLFLLFALLEQDSQQGLQLKALLPE